MNYIMDLHTHSIASGHGYSTFQENVAAARAKGLAVYGFSEHAPAMPGGPHPFFFTNFRVLPDEIDGMRILKGCEANIMNLDGGLDLEERILSRLDYCIASMHIPCVTPGSAKENTDCCIKVMENPYVQILGHPDDGRYPLEYERLVLAAKERHVLLEVNNTSLSPNTSRKNGRENVKTFLTYCKKYEVPVILGTDSHYCAAIGDFGYAEAMLKALDFPEELVINDSVEKLRTYIPKV